LSSFSDSEGSLGSFSRIEDFSSPSSNSDGKMFDEMEGSLGSLSRIEDFSSPSSNSDGKCLMRWTNRIRWLLRL
jgi:hypothetical protein